MPVQHIESGYKRPVNRTTLMWAGIDWEDVGPLEENRWHPPFHCMTLDEIPIDRVEAGGCGHRLPKTIEFPFGE